MKDTPTLISEVLEKLPNKYMAVIVASKRARAINDGQRPLVKISGSSKSTTAAMAEIAEGAIVIAEASEIEAAKASEMKAAKEVAALELKMPETEAESAEEEKKEAKEEKQLLPSSDSPKTDEQVEQAEEDEKEDKEE